MKNLIFFASLFLLSFTTIKASEKSLDYNRYYSTNGESFNFVENNVHFMVYQNGEFDFFIRPNGVNVNMNFGVANISFNSGYNYDTYVQYDDYGAVIQIENIPIYYDYYGRISRIGTTYIRYNNRRLIQFGNMYVHYNPFGYFDYYSGFINVYNRHYNFRPYLHYFARPIYNNCLVSYRPYRRHYTPLRYRYNSADYRRRARRTRVATSVRRNVPRRVAPRTRTTVRRTNEALTVRNRNTANVIRSTRQLNTDARNNTVRNTRQTMRSTPTRNSRTVRNTSVRERTSTARKNPTRNNKRTIRVKNTDRTKRSVTSKTRSIASKSRKTHSTRRNSRK